MLKTLLSSLSVAVLCGPALAGTPSTYRIDFATRVGGQAQRYTVFVADNSCGEIEVKSPSRESMFRVCAEPTEQNRVKLEVERRTRERADETRTKAVVIAASGSSYELLDAKMTVKTQ